MRPLRVLLLEENPRVRDALAARLGAEAPLIAEVVPCATVDEAGAAGPVDVPRHR